MKCDLLKLILKNVLLQIKTDKVSVIMVILVKFVGIGISSGICYHCLGYLQMLSVMLSGQEALFYQMSSEAELPQHTN